MGTVTADVSHWMLTTNTRPLIITAMLDGTSQTCLDDLRRQYFPPERNYLRAHLTMFHALPGELIDDIETLLADMAARNSVLNAEVCGLRSLGGGVAFNICTPELEKMRREIASAFHDALTRQDQQLWRPHITIQNKVSRENASALFTRLQQKFEPWTIRIEGLDLWRYDGGPWESAGSFPFTRRSMAAT